MAVAAARVSGASAGPRLAYHATGVTNLEDVDDRICAMTRSLEDGATGSGTEDRFPPDRYWTAEAVGAVLDRTRTYWMAPDLSGLTAGERRVVRELVAAGRIAQALYEDQLHHQARAAHRDLVVLDREFGSPARTRDLLTLYEVNQGPISPTLENELLPFLPVDGYTAGKNVYPWGIELDELERFLGGRPEERPELLHLRSAVRRTSRVALRRDLAVMRRHPEIEPLHPGLAGRLERLLEKPERAPYYAVPYSLAWAGPIRRICDHLWAAAAAAEGESPDFAAYLRLRARDLLTDDYEAGDAAWVRGTFGRIDAVIGAHETYDDDLYGSKAFFGLSLTIQSAGREQAQIEAMAHLQAIQDQLPYDRPRRVRTDIPVRIDDTIATFGNARLVVAQILPNEEQLNRKYGRKIVFRSNETMHPASARRMGGRWRAALLPAHWGDYDPRGELLGTFWHEIGHYLGPEKDDAGRPVIDALEGDGGLLEELKSELIAQSAVQWLFERGLATEAERRAVIASGLISGLRPVRPLRSQTYETLWLMELNFFLEHGFLAFEDGRLGLRYERHADVVSQLLRRVLDIQARGARADANALIERYSTWDDRNEAIARAVNAADRSRFLYPRYAILGGMPKDGGLSDST